MDTKVHTQKTYEALAAQFGTEIVDQLNYRRFAPLVHHVDESVPYVRVFPSTGSERPIDRPVVYVPGFTEGEVAKAPFAAAMAEQGATVIMPGQNRTKIVRDALHGRNATYAQARNMLSVIRHEGLSDGGFDIVTHSYGSLVFDAMASVSEGMPTFEGSRVVMLAPAGLNPRENPLRLGKRFAQSNLGEMRLREQEVADVDGSMLRAGIGNLAANIPRTCSEIRDLYRNRLSIPTLFTTARIGSLAVVAYAHDKTFPYSVLDDEVSAAMEMGLPVTYATPYASTANGNGVIMGAREATHNDEQFQPRRVAGTTLALLTEPLL